MHLEPDQLGDQLSVKLRLAVSVSVLDGDILAIDVAEVVQPQPECRSVRLSQRCRLGREQDTDPRHSPRLLRLSTERRGKEAASDSRQDEGPTLHHSITWSAGSSSADRIVRPTAGAASSS
jgi:hypothetical protein